MKRGEVYLVNPQPVKGAELARIRPAVVVSTQAVLDQPSMPVTVMFGVGAEHYPILNEMLVKVEAKTGHFHKDTVFCAWQLKACDRTRFSDPKSGQAKYLSTLDFETMQRIDRAMLFALGLDNYFPLAKD